MKIMQQPHFIYVLAIISLVWSDEKRNIYNEIIEFGKRLDFEFDLFRENIKTLVDESKAPDVTNAPDSQSESFRSDICDSVNKNDNETSSESERRQRYLVNGLKSEKEFIRKGVEDLKLRINEIERNMFVRFKEVVTDIDEIKTLIGDLRKQQNILEKSMTEVFEATSTDVLNTMISREVKQAENNLKRELDNTVIPIKRDTQALRSEFSEQEKYINDMFSNISARLQEIEEKKDCGTWTYFHESCYFYFNKGLSWTNARDQCVSRGAYLVEIDSEKEYQFIIQFTGMNIDEYAFGVWFGASDTDKEGLWKWASSGNLLQDGYTQWTGREPNGGRRENCLHWYRSARKWNDVKCNASNNFICERKLALNNI